MDATLLRPIGKALRRVAVISETMARHFFGTGDPIGLTFVLGSDKHKTFIVGVVEDARHERLRSDIPSRMVYLPVAQIGAGPDGTADVPNRLTLSVRTSEDRTALAPDIQSEVQALSKDAMVPYRADDGAAS